MEEHEWVILPTRGEYPGGGFLPTGISCLNLLCTFNPNLAMPKNPKLTVVNLNVNDSIIKKYDITIPFFMLPALGNRTF